MPDVIRDGAIVADDWHLLRPASDADAAAVVVPSGRWLVPFPVWRSQRRALALRSGADAVGVWLSAADDLALVAADLAAWALIAVDFPKFTDGRGYTIARELRVRHRYGGELRAIGDVLVDQLHFMARVGFTSFALAPGRAAQVAHPRLAPFPHAYQGSSDDPRPLFRRLERAGEGARP